jgi:hypothetical protein
LELAIPADEKGNHDHGHQRDGQALSRWPSAAEGRSLRGRDVVLVVDHGAAVCFVYLFFLKKEIK